MTNKFTLLAAGVLIWIPTLRNVQLMLIMSIVGLLISLGFLSKNREQSSVMAITLGYFLMLIIAIFFFLKK